MAEPAATLDSPPKRAGDLILDVACTAFYRQGIRAVGVDEVVTRAGFTKPSLYRAFGSKEGLISAYLRVHEAAFWTRWDEAAALHPLDPRAQLMTWLNGLTQATGTRGCGLSNAAVEFPEADHPARLAAEAAKAELRTRLRDLARRIGAADPDSVGDGLLLLVEGAMLSGQVFAADGPAAALVRAAEALLGVGSTAERQTFPAGPPQPAKPARSARPKPRAAVVEEQPMLF